MQKPKQREATTFPQNFEIRFMYGGMHKNYNRITINVIRNPLVASKYEHG